MLIHPQIALIDGLPPGTISTATRQVLDQWGHLATAHELQGETLAPCQGCFECWTTRPGQCKTDDAANAIMRDCMGADAVLWTTRLRFGCWSATTKAALDRSIGILSPFFTTIRGETHHHRRYRHYPRWGVLAVVDAKTLPRERELFQVLVRRNALNLYSAAPWVGFVDEGAEPAAVRAMVLQGIRALSEHAPADRPFVSPFAPRVDSRGVPEVAGRRRHVTLWVGSAKPTGTSISECLGRNLVEQLERRGWTSSTIHAAQVSHLRHADAPELVAAFRAADLVVLAAPVYIDSLPALVLHGLEALAGAELGTRRPALLPIVQSGFPELDHTALAVEIASNAADRLGLHWVGHLALGGGGSVPAPPLSSHAGRAAPLIAALDAAARELDEGSPLSAATIDAFAAASMPPWLYRGMANLGWLAQAAQHHALLALWRRPFEDGELSAAGPPPRGA